MEPFINADTLLIEPSAGGGVFLDEIDRDVLGLDIAPDNDLIIQRDFLSLPVTPRSNIAFIGNPPFGRQGALAAQFINRALKMAGTVGFILPLCFAKWSGQRMVNRDARLVLHHELPARSFSFCGKLADVRCIFQVWTTNTDWADLRLRDKPPHTHPDFGMRVYNGDGPAPEDWDFAVLRRDVNDYSQKLWIADEFDARYKYLLFNASSPAVLRRLLRIDYQSIAERYAVRSNISKADVVQAYKMLAEG